MKLGVVILGVITFLVQGEGLNQTQEKAHKFLIEKGHVGTDSIVENFHIDRQGNLRLSVQQAGQVISYGLRPHTDSYEIVFMKKNKSLGKKLTEAEVQALLAHLINQKYAILQGGKLGALTYWLEHHRSQFRVDYTLNGKTYNIKGRFNPKRGELQLDSIEETLTGLKAMILHE